ncbi:MAG TPA: class I SAM-dependent methyltransferase [Bacteroidetes bacterium]|nr:class I SAM-dependent methyltransferase [Bacteroidota bacterium]HEX04374.1 class I SAM-dependent methyltransferase [Bacteroidota bacterium]
MNCARLLQRTSFTPKMLGSLASFSTVWWLIVQAFQRKKKVSGVVAGAALALFLVIGLLIELIMRVVNLNRVVQANHVQMQALFGLQSELKPEHAFPTLGGWALKPQVALHYVQIIRQMKPEVVVEFGSGVSTLLSALQLEKNGSGKVIAFDHEQKWLQHTKYDLHQHGVGHRTEIRHSPLTTIEIEGKNVQWYDTKILEDIDRIDVMLVDGPPDTQDKGTRQPALSLLADKFHDNSVIIVDDTARPVWNSWVHMWAANNGFLVEEPAQLDGAALVLYKRDSDYYRLREEL